MWLLEKVKIVEMLGDKAQSGYGEVRRVRIARMTGIPTDCDLLQRNRRWPPPSSNNKPNVWRHVLIQSNIQA